LKNEVIAVSAESPAMSIRKNMKERKSINS